MPRSPKAEPTKTCTGPCARSLPLSVFNVDSRRGDGRRARCRGCESKGLPPEPEPPKVSRAEERRLSRRADAEALRQALSGDPAYRAERGAELKRRGEAREDGRLSDAAALRRNFLLEAESLLKRCEGRIVATGRAKAAPKRPAQQTAVLLLSDLHVGSHLHPRENPIPFGPEEESRRLASILQRVLDFDPKRRDDTEVLLLLGGDLIEGQIGHSTSAARLAAQFKAIWDLLGGVIAHLAAEFPRVRLASTPGNHERVISIHPHRATDSRWDGYGTVIYDGLRREAKTLKNVAFEQTLKGYTLTRLYDAWLYLLHLDEQQFGPPETKSGANLDRLVKLFNSDYLTEILPAKPAVVCGGHWHSPFHIPGQPPFSPHFFVNGALCPPNPWAKAAGYLGRPAGQWFFVSRPGDPVAEVTFLGVGRADDANPRLNDLLPVYRLEAA